MSFAVQVRGVFGQLCIAPGAFPDIHGPWPHDMNKMLTWWVIGRGD